MIISARPYPSARTLLTKGGAKLPELEFYSLGREALLSALLGLGLIKGDSIAVPAYMCSSTIQPLEDYGFRLIFIDVDDQLDLPVDNLQTVAAKTKINALLLVHYFGFLQNSAEIMSVCRSLNIKLVEDFSHSFFSGFLADDTPFDADAKIFSIRKSLPIVDGGALSWRNAENGIKTDNPSCFALFHDSIYLLKRLVEKLVTMLNINIYSERITRGRQSLSTGVEEGLKKHACQPSWQLKKYLCNAAYLQTAQQRILKNFTKLSTKLEALGFDLLHKTAQPGEVPQALVAYDHQGGLADYLRAQGIGAWRWPAEEMPDAVASQIDKYPNANYYNKTLVLLPIHQSVSNRQINYMIQVLSQWQQQ